MKRPLLLLSAVLALAALSGCDTFESRAKKKPEVLAALDPAAREKLRRGIIEIGNTTDMVYLALGQPDDEYETTSARGKEKTWIFNSYQQDYAGTVQTGYHRMLVYDPATKGYIVYFEPVYNNVYTERIEERIRITFQDGKVTVIEQPKPN
ncbi:MAG: hypothetical protein JSS11_16870 [Verrucomicrobia bacterium]|nr:hypothetical protein [Verrucomicrobiota bacterium]